jgi:putative spermidine/putrescine transport system permease protein
VICFPAAKALVFYDFYGKSLVKTLLVMPIIIPIIAVAMGIHLTMIRLGLSNTITGVVLVQVIPCIPYVVRILMNSYEVIGNKIEIQAKVLGASKFETLRYVSFPMLKHAISSALKMAFILSYSQYIITLIIGGGIVKTHSVIIFPIIQSGSRSEIALNSLLFIISIVFVNWLIDKVFSYVKEAK